MSIPAKYKLTSGDLLLTPHPLSLSPFKGEREEIFKRGFAPLIPLLDGLPLERCD
jgi:hypothetical protein